MSRVILCLEFTDSHLLYVHIHILWVFVKRYFTLLTVQSNTNNFQTSLWPQNWTVTSTTTLGLCGPNSNGNKGVLHTPQTLKLKSHSQRQFSVESKTTPFWIRMRLLHSWRYSQRIIRPTEKTNRWKGI